MFKKTGVLFCCLHIPKAVTSAIVSNGGFHIKESIGFLYKDKREQLKEISKRSGVPLHKIVLVEDSIEQIKAARSIGAKAVLYKRGYSTLAQKKEARKSRVPLVDWTKRFDSRKLKRMAR